MSQHFDQDGFVSSRAVPARERGALSYQKGRAAEDQVAQHYEATGAILLHKRWRGKAGEVDLILQQGDDVVFVEVKSSRSHDRALAMVSPSQLQRLCFAAQEYLDGCPRGSLTPMRLDVATVDAGGDIRILENALM